MMAVRILHRKALRDLGRRRAQLAAVAVTVGIGVAVFVASFDAYRNLEASYEQVYDELAFADLWVTGGDVDAVAAAAAADPEVEAVAQRVQVDLAMEIDGHRFLGRVVTVPEAREELAVNRLLVTEGSYPTDGHEVLLEQHAADAFGLGPGDMVRVFVDGSATEMPIAGVAVSAEYLWPARSRDEVVTVPEEFAVVFAPDGLAAGAGISEPRQLVLRAGPAAAERLLDAAQRAGATEAYLQADQPSHSTLAIDVQGFGEMAVLFPVLFLSSAGLAAYVLLARLVQLDRPVIGALMANGVARRTLVRHYAVHAGVAVFAGAIPGLVVGEALAGLTTRLYTSELDIPVTATHVRPLTPLIALGFAVLTAGLAGVGPVRTAATVAPAEAMRPPTPPGGGRISVIERVVPWPLPRGVRMVLRNLWRRPKRSLSTAVGTVLAALVVVTSAGLDDSMQAGMSRQFDEVDRRDMTVLLDHPATAEDVATATSWPQVAVAEPTGELSSQLSSAAATGTVALQLVPPDTALHGFDARYAGGLVITRDLARQLAVAVGDVVDLHTETTGGSVPVTQVVTEPLSGTAYLDLATWESLGGGRFPAVALRLTEGADVDALQDRLQAEPGVIAVVDHRAVADAIEELLGLLAAVVYVMIAFGIALAVSLIFNSVTVAIGERTTEVATLVANGVRSRRINGWILAETLLVVTVALVPGILLGRAASAGFLRSIDTGVFALEPHLATRTWVAVSFLLVAAAAVAHVGPLRRLDRLDLAAVVRERQA